METLAAPLIRLAVLPSHDPAAAEDEESYFSRGFVEDLITDLSRFPALGLISPRSSFAERFRSVSDQEIADGLHSDFLLRINVRKRGADIRIHARLVDPESAGILWAERYDAPQQEVFSLQDSLVEKVAAALSLRIDALTLEAARRKPVTELEAYDCWLRGMEKLREATLESDDEARGFFERALDIDPHYARAYVGLSLSHFNEWSCQNWHLSELSECRAFQYANRALQLDRGDPVAHLVAGRVHLFRRDFERASKHLDTAYELNPNDADQLVQIASCKAFLGEADAALAIFNRALDLNPCCDSWYYAYGGFIRIVRREYEEGIAMALKAPLTGVWIDLSGFIALAHARLGDQREAAVYREVFHEAFQERILKGRPPRPGEALDWLVTVNPFRRPDDSDFYREGLLLAGFSDLPEPGKPVAQRVRAGGPAVFRLESDLRLMAFDGLRVQLPEVKGFSDIARLLISVGTEIHCTDLMGSVSEDGESSEVMDARARHECAVRIRELQAELAELEDLNDLARAESVRAELDPLLDHLGKSVGIGGRSRKMAAPAERARSAVTWRIRSAIRKIEPAHPALGRHLDLSIRTGTFCSYAPEKPLDWVV